MQSHFTIHQTARVPTHRGSRGEPRRIVLACPPSAEIKTEPAGPREND